MKLGEKKLIGTKSKELNAWSFDNKAAFLPDVGTPDVDAVLDLASGEMLAKH